LQHQDREWSIPGSRKRGPHIGPAQITWAAEEQKALAEENPGNNRFRMKLCNHHDKKAGTFKFVQHTCAAGFAAAAPPATPAAGTGCSWTGGVGDAAFSGTKGSGVAGGSGT